MPEYLKLFDANSEYKTYISGDAVFPNVSYVEDIKRVYYSKSKPLATTFINGTYYVSEMEYIYDAIQKEYARLGLSGNIKLNLETELITDYDKEFEFMDKKLITYLRNLQISDFGNNISPVVDVYLYPDQFLYFGTESGDVGMGFSFYNEVDYGLFFFAVG